MAGCAADLVKHGLTHEVSVLHRRIVRYHATRNGQCRLEQRNRRQVGYRQLVGKTIPIRVGIEPETFFGLLTVVMVERIVAELSN
jgi:hypothetical protein